MTDFKKLRSCNRALRFLGGILFCLSLMLGIFSSYAAAAWAIGMAVFFRIIANEGPQ